MQERSSRIVRVGRGSGGVVASEVRQGRTRSGETSYMHDESFYQDPPGRDVHSRISNAKDPVIFGKPFPQNSSRAKRAR